MDRRSRTSVAELAPPAAAPERTLGDRVRRLRNARGLTQSELAASRVSKEYISQIETGKTRPTQQTLEWLAERLGVDFHYLDGGVSEREYRHVDSVVAQAEEAIREKRYRDAVDLVASIPRTPDAPDLHLRALFAESWARMYLGDVRSALDVLERARGVAEADVFGDVLRAEVQYRLGCCRYKLSSIDPALRHFSHALELAERSGVPCDVLRANVFHWRSRCYRRHRDWEAAREDIERALELAEALNDSETVAHAYFQASLVAERQGEWRRARNHSERAKELYEAIDDPINVGRLLNNLGILSFLLGDPEQAVAQLKEAFRIALEVDDRAEGANAVCSLAQIHLRMGEPELAEQQARHALELLDGRVDYLDEIGNAQLVLGRCLMEQDRLSDAQDVLEEAETSLCRLSSASHRAAAWTAQGDLALRRGDDRRAGMLYRRAAETLQENEF